MKKSTQLEHSILANNLMYYIYKNIDTNINIDELARDFNISKFHLHRVFKEQIGSNIYESIKSIRLQKASNLLITNFGSTISEIANLCGYSSQSSFIRAFKSRFKMTPKEWRRGGYKLYSNSILKSSQYASKSLAKFDDLEPKIVKANSQLAYYIRHKGYNKNIKKIWQKLEAWIYTNEIKNYKQIGIYHDNPIITPLDKCYYIASVVIDDNKVLENTTLPYFKIPKGLYATFEVSGEYGDILKLIQWVYHIWLPQSGYETTTNPSYTIMHKNHFLEDNEKFRVTYYLPINLSSTQYHSHNKMRFFIGDDKFLQD
jgi:AraC family transcriptional regulator